MDDLVSKGWFEDSPKDWDVFRMKNIMNPKEGRSKSGEEELLSVTINRGVVKRTEYLEDEEGGSRSETLVGYKLVGTAGDILAQTSEIRFFRWKKKWFNVRAENLDSFWKKKMGGGTKAPPQPAD